MNARHARPIVGCLSLALLQSLTTGAAAQPAAVTAQGQTWTLQNEALSATVAFADGKLSLASLANRAADTDYLKNRPPLPLFSFAMGNATVTAADAAAKK